MAVYLGKKLVLANGVGGTSLALGHAATHGTGGGDEITPASIGAAAAEHTHSQYVERPEAVQVTLPKAGWTQYTYSCTQTLQYQGMRGSKTVIVCPDPGSWNRYVGANVRCSVQGYNALTFSADKMPLEDLNVNLLIWG